MLNNLNRYLIGMVVILVLLIRFGFAYGNSQKMLEKPLVLLVSEIGTENELSRRNPNTGEEELFNTQDGKYYRIVDKRAETQKEVLEAGESGDVKIDRNEINSYEIVPMPDCSDNSHRTQGIMVLCN